MARAVPLHPATAERDRIASCLGKQGFATRGEAVKHFPRLPRKGRRPETYRCRHCGLWHIGGSNRSLGD